MMFFQTKVTVCLACRAPRRMIAPVRNSIAAGEGAHGLHGVLCLHKLLGDGSISESLWKSPNINTDKMEGHATKNQRAKNGSLLSIYFPLTEMEPHLLSVHLRKITNTITGSLFDLRARRKCEAKKMP